MRKKWTGYAIVFSLLVGLLMPAGQIKAAENSVKVTLPNFEVKLNGHTVENQYREYPLLVYRDVTYIPMTWNDTRMLGLEAIWSSAAGLNIKQSKVTSSYETYKSKSRNATTYSAKISTSAITVNGKVINNSKEKYPLLSFRNVTYFPLTWRFAHDEFGWEYKWKAASGLSITSHNPQLQTVGLPAFATDNDVALFKGHYYFVDTKATSVHIYRAPVNQLSARKEIYSYTFDKDSDFRQDDVAFIIRDHALWFSYHRGSGSGGSDVFIRIGDDGKTKVVDTGYSRDFRDTPFGTLIIDNRFDNESGYLYFKEGTKYKSVGDLDTLRFAHSESENGLSATTVVGDYVYVLLNRAANDPYFIYRINLKTNKTEKIVDESTNWFRIANNKLYYTNNDEGNVLYSATLEGTNQTKLSEHAVSWFDSIDGNLFYTSKKDSKQFELYKVNTSGKDTLLSTTPFTSVQVINKQLVCLLGSNDGVVLLDSEGSLLLKVAEPIKRLLTSDNGILLQNSKNSSLKIIR